MKYLSLSRVVSQMWLLSMLSIVGSGCAVKLIADYDEPTDKAVTELQRKAETFFVDLASKLGTPGAAHENFAETYKELRVDISAIELRASAIPKNQITQDQIKALDQNIELLEKLHRTGLAIDAEGKNAVLIGVQEDFNRALTAILKLELAKRRGEKAEEPSQ